MYNMTCSNETYVYIDSHFSIFTVDLSCNVNIRLIFPNDSFITSHS